jgi:hypothetical protein
LFNKTMRNIHDDKVLYLNLVVNLNLYFGNATTKAMS